MLDMTYGVNNQVLAVAALLCRADGVESSWNASNNTYRSRIDVAPWYNGRERGLSFRLYDNAWKAKKQLIVVVYEHRNSDDICTIEWTDKAGFLNPPTLNDIPEGVYKDKYDTTFSVGYGQIREMAEHISEQFDQFCEAWPAA